MVASPLNGRFIVTDSLGVIRAWEMKRIVNEVTQVPRRAAILISGAFKYTTVAAPNIELFLLLMHLLID